MGTYSVKQIADILETNEETVRRWIRNKKLKAYSSTQKGAKAITEDDFKDFLSRMPKYLAKSAAATAISPAIGAATLAGSLAGSIIAYRSRQKSKDTKIDIVDFKKYLSGQISELEKKISDSESMIQKLQQEIIETRKKINHYSYILENDELIKNSFEEAGDDE